MADTKISALASAGALDGTETVPILQAAANKKVLLSVIATYINSLVSVAWSSITGKPTTLSGFGITDAQPLDSDLTAIAALSTTSFGRALLTLADAAGMRSTSGAAASGAAIASGLTMATARLLGRTTASTGAIEEISVGTGLSLSGGALSATGAGLQYQYEPFGALPLSSSFTVVTGANLTLTDGNKSLRVSWTASGANAVQLYTKAAPSTPYDVYMRLRPLLAGTNVQFGIVLRNSSTGKFVILGINTTPGIGVQEWTNPTTFSSQVIASTANQPFTGTAPGWLRVNNDGTTLTFYYSGDGDLWVSLGTRTIATFLGSVDQYGFGAVCQSAAQAWVSSFGTAAPA